MKNALFLDQFAEAFEFHQQLAIGELEFLREWMKQLRIETNVEFLTVHFTNYGRQSKSSNLDDSEQEYLLPDKAQK